MYPNSTKLVILTPLCNTISPPLPSPVRVYNSTLCSNTYVLSFTFYMKKLDPDRPKERPKLARGDQLAMVIKLIYSHYY